MRGLSPSTNYLWDEILSFIAGYERWDPKKATADLENPTLITNFFSLLDEKLDAVEVQLRAIEEARVKAELAAERARVAEEKKAAEIEEAAVEAAAVEAAEREAAEREAVVDVEGGLLGEGVLAGDFAEVEGGEADLITEDDVMVSGGEAEEVEVVSEEEGEEEDEEVDEGDGGGESSSVTVTRAKKRGRKKSTRPNKTSRPIRDLAEDEARDL
jgi:hypothetical protein